MPSAAPPLPAEAFAERLAAAAPRFDVELPPASVRRLSRYLALLDAARRRTNLTGRLSAAELVEHAFESAFGGRFLPSSSRVVDVGSGAGFPGLPLAIARPDATVLALEPRRLRADFLAQAVRDVPIGNCEVLCGKAFGIPPSTVDVAVSRAVGDMAKILGSAPFLKPGGLYLSWTTQPGTLAKSLGPAFFYLGAEPVPRSKSKVIARFQTAS